MIQVYQTTEDFKRTCSEGNLHLNEDILYVEKEYLDDSRFIRLLRISNGPIQPIYRYRLNDILVEEGLCPPCGFIFANRKDRGRSDDIFYFKKKMAVAR